MKVDLSNVVPLPEGFSISRGHSERYWNLFAPFVGYVTIDAGDRVWRWGANRRDGNPRCPRQEGRGWQKKLVRSAIAALQEVAKS